MRVVQNFPAKKILTLNFPMGKIGEAKLKRYETQKYFCLISCISVNRALSDKCHRTVLTPEIAEKMTADFSIIYETKTNR